MSHAYRLLVRDNIESLGEDINVVSQKFYSELFHIDITLKNIFHGDVVFLNRKFSNMLGTFKNVKHLEKISASVEKMGERHMMQYGAQLEHFTTIQQALLIALKKHFGEAFTTELEAAWSYVFQEVADIMKNAMQNVERRQIKRTLPDSQEKAVELLAEVGGEQGLLNVHQRFYDVIFEEPWLGQFFYGKSKEALIDKQTKFMLGAFGGENNYTGDTPAFVHMHMFLTDEMCDLRQKILRKAITDEGYSKAVAEYWLKIDDSFRESIIKKSASDCVLKCPGQMPIIAKKPLNY